MIKSKSNNIDTSQRARATIVSRPCLRIDILSVVLSHYDNLLRWQCVNLDDVHA